MTQPEFDRWWADLTMRFPSVESWMGRVAPEEISQRTMLRSWLGVLESIELKASLDVNRQMQAGDLPFVENFQEERIPQHVRRFARQIMHSRGQRTAQELPQDYKPSHFPAGKIVRRLLELTDKGIPAPEAKEIVLSELPVGKPSYEHRYHCAACLDCGSILTASTSAIRAMLSDKFEICRHHTSSCRCKCKQPLPADSRFQQATYDASMAFKVQDHYWWMNTYEVDRFREWCEAKRDEYWSSKREPAFDAFNERRFV